MALAQTFKDAVLREQKTYCGLGCKDADRRGNTGQPCISTEYQPRQTLSFFVSQLQMHWSSLHPYEVQ